MSTPHPLVAHAARLRDALGALDDVAADFDRAVTAIATALERGGKVVTAGNGGSAAAAQHLAGEFVGRLSADRERSALAAIALTADSSTIIALANDYGFDAIFARQIEALGRSGDVFVALSTSGASPNLVEAVKAASSSDLTTIGILGGTRRALHECCDIAIAVPATATATVQECHLAMLHVLVAEVEHRLSHD